MVGLTAQSAWLRAAQPGHLSLLSIRLRVNSFWQLPSCPKDGDMYLQWGMHMTPCHCGVL